MPPQDADRRTSASAAAAGAPGSSATAPQSDWSALMALSQEGDRAAYVSLLQSVTPYLRALARRGGVDGAEIEDAVQDVLLMLHAIRHTYDPRRPFGPWLLAIARHRMADRLRRRGRLLARETALGEEHVTFAADETNNPEWAESARRLRAAISALPAGQRQAVELLRLKELSLKEAAARSGQTETALKVAMHRAIKRLRRLLGEG